MTKQYDHTVINVFNARMTILEAETNGHIKVTRDEEGAVVDYVMTAKQPPNLLESGEFNGTVRTHS